MPASPTAAPASGVASEQERGPDGRLKLALHWTTSHEHDADHKKSAEGGVAMRQSKAYGLIRSSFESALSRRATSFKHNQPLAPAPCQRVSAPTSPWRTGQRKPKKDR